MTQPPVRPTAEISDVILDSMDTMIGQLMERLKGLTNDEHLWEPTAEVWSVRADEAGKAVVDGVEDKDTDPAPVTTIAWRLWHLADCLGDYALTLEGRKSDISAEWTLDAKEAIGILEQKWLAYRSIIAGRHWWDELGTDWGRWSQHSIGDMAMHASNELVHHGAEIALLRDLYRASHDGQLMIGA